MHWLIILSFVLVLLSSSSVDAHGRPCCPCLPKGIKRTDIVSYLPSRAVSDQPERIDDRKAVTVEDKLVELKARCRKGRLVGRTGKPIYFFHLTGCWGNPPDNYQEILDEQNKELARLRKRYTVIEMTCNPSGQQIP